MYSDLLRCFVVSLGFLFWRRDQQKSIRYFLCFAYVTTKTKKLTSELITLTPPHLESLQALCQGYHFFSSFFTNYVLWFIYVAAQKIICFIWMHRTGEAFFRTEPLRWEDKDALCGRVFVWFFDSHGVRLCAVMGWRPQREALLIVGASNRFGLAFGWQPDVAFELRGFVHWVRFCCCYP